MTHCALGQIATIVKIVTTTKTVSAWHRKKREKIERNEKKKKKTQIVTCSFSFVLHAYGQHNPG